MDVESKLLPGGGSLVGGNPPSTGRQKGLAIGSRTRAERGSRREEADLGLFQNQSLSEDGRRQRRDRSKRAQGRLK